MSALSTVAAMVHPVATPPMAATGGLADSLKRCAFLLNSAQLAGVEDDTAREHIRAAVEAAEALLASAPPAIGQPWQGGTYAGLARGQNGQPDYHLVLLADKPDKRLAWQAALAWAETLPGGASLPTRDESALLYAFLRDEFDMGWHWTSTQCSAGHAWGQIFGYGSQGVNVKSYEARARAARRFTAQSFDPLKDAS